MKKKNIIKIILITAITFTSLFFNSNKNYAANYNLTERFVNGWSLNGIAWGQAPILLLNGSEAFCLEGDKAAHVGVNNTIQFSDIGIDENLEDKLGLIAYYGYRENPNDENYFLTQNLIWKILNYNCYSTSTTYPTLASQQAWQNLVMAKVNAYSIRPSFDGTAVTVNVNQPLTITDTNNVLNGYTITNSGGLNISQNGNSLTIVGSTTTPTNTTINMRRILNNGQIGNNFVVRNGSSQAVGVCRTADPEVAYFDIHINKYIDVTLTKSDLETGNKAQGDASLLGAEYSLFKSDGTLISTKVVDNNLQLKFEQVMCGDTYYIQETKAPLGYILNSEKIAIDPTALLTNGTVGSNLQHAAESKEQVVKQAFQIIKVSSDGSSTEVPTVAGAEFTVKLQSEVDLVGWANAKTYDVIITDVNGYAKSIELPYGTYLVKETKVPANMSPVRDFTVVVDKDSREPQKYRILNDSPFKAYLKIAKKDKETGELIKFTSASFQIKDSAGKVVTQKVGDKYINTFTTNEDGTVTTPLMLGAGTYTIDEVKTPNGYLTLETPFSFEITNQGAVQVDQDNDPIIEVVIENSKPTGKIVINKLFEKSENLSNENLYAKFKLIVTADIINPADGEIMYYAGDIISNLEATDGLYSTDENMQVIIDNLPIGIDVTKFKVVEVETSDGYKFIDPIEVEFKQADLTTKEYMYTVDIENKLYKPSIGTLATGVNGEKILDPTIDNLIIDEIMYKDFDISKEYTLVTELVCKETNQVISSIKTENIILDSIDGKYEVKLTLPANTVADGEFYFREFFYTNNNPDIPYAEHNDKNDEGQTIRFETLKLPTIEPTQNIIQNIVTGDSTSFVSYIVLVTSTLGVFCVVFRNNRKRKKLIKNQEV